MWPRYIWHVNYLGCVLYVISCYVEHLYRNLPYVGGLVSTGSIARLKGTRMLLFSDL